MDKQVKQSEQGAKSAWPDVMSWVGRATALIGLFATLAGGVTWFVAHHRQQKELRAKMELAQTQASHGEYQASVQTYADILKANSLYVPALDGQLNTTMQWVEDFHGAPRDDQGSASAPALDQIMAVLDAAMTRVHGTEAADIQAHIGWAHWLNQHIAQREFGPAAEKNLRAALLLDPSNVYAHAMLGNWMLQNGRDLTEAVRHFDVAVSTGKVRPFVRIFQLGGLQYLDKPGARAAQIKAANDMRKAGEPIDESYKSRILSFCFDPIVTDHRELVESLSAVSQDETLKTYLWLSENQDSGQDEGAKAANRDFIEANLLEIAGKRQQSLAKYRLLQHELANQGGRLKTSIDESIARLSHI